MMRAAVQTSYDAKNPHVELTRVRRPGIGPHQALIKVSAAGVNPLDIMIARGEVRLITPYALPLVAGNEMVGIVEQVGSSARSLELGQRVFSRLPLGSIGAFAEYVAVDADALAAVPEHLTDEEAAAVPLTALTAVQALDLMGATAGGTIFISGGTGSVGAMAIPIAKSRGLTVVTNGSAPNRERVLSLGADRFLDYRTEDYAQVLNGIDYVLDTLGGEETRRQMGVMRRGGHLVSLRGLPNGAFASRMGMPAWKRALFTAAGWRLDRAARGCGVRYDFIFVESNGAQLQEVADLLSSRRIVPSVDEVFPFGEVGAALDEVANGHSRGKTVLSMTARR